MTFQRSPSVAAFLSTAIFLALAITMDIVGTPHAAADGAFTETPANFKVAFIGDQSTNGHALDVLNLIAQEGADMVLHSGDLGYGDESNQNTAVRWDEQISQVLGEEFPYFASVGNHDVGDWPVYQELLLNRALRVPGAPCSGDYGVKSTCSYQGLFFVLSGVGTMGFDQDEFIEDALAEDNSLWRICSWHRTQRAMQIGAKEDEVGWPPYEACREGRAIVATAHEHSYARTRTLISMEAQVVDPDWPRAEEVRVAPGASFTFVSGLGGESLRGQKRCRPTEPPYGCEGEWAYIYSADQHADYGALFIEFNVDGRPDKARGYFKDISGNTIDSFTVISEPNGTVVDLDAAPQLLAGPDSTQSSGVNGMTILTVAIALTTGLAGAVWYVRTVSAGFA